MAWVRIRLFNNDKNERVQYENVMLTQACLHLFIFFIAARICSLQADCTIFISLNLQKMWIK